MAIVKEVKNPSVNVTCDLCACLCCIGLVVYSFELLSVGQAQSD